MELTGRVVAFLTANRKALRFLILFGIIFGISYFLLELLLESGTASLSPTLKCWPGQLPRFSGLSVRPEPRHLALS
jgi:hypothetical protein